MDIRTENTGFVVGHHHQFVTRRLHRWQSSIGTPKEMSDRHQIVYICDILGLRPVEGQSVPVSHEVPMAIGSFGQFTQMTEQRKNFAPLEIVGNGMLKNLLPGSEVRAVQRWRRCHELLLNLSWWFVFQINPWHSGSRTNREFI